MVEYLFHYCRFSLPLLFGRTPPTLQYLIGPGSFRYFPSTLLSFFVTAMLLLLFFVTTPHCSISVSASDIYDLWIRKWMCQYVRIVSPSELWFHWPNFRQLLMGLSTGGSRVRGFLCLMNFVVRFFSYYENTHLDSGRCDTVWTNWTAWILWCHYVSESSHNSSRLSIRRRSFHLVDGTLCSRQFCVLLLGRTVFLSI